ncbi:hypothetical protein IPM19_04220 [bacterium]|nr:MAG: hypothetical protein IPM19_04220 [bacterium]
MADINLLDSQAHTNVIRARSKQWILRLVTIALVAALLLYAGLFLFSWQAERKTADVKRTIDSTVAEMQNNEKRKELLTRQGQLKNIDQLLTTHLYWSGLLPELARVTLTSAQYTSISATDDGTLELTVTVPSYAEAEKFLQVFDLPEYNKQFSNVKVMSLAKAEQGNLLATSMRLSLTLNKDLLKK